MKYVDFLEEFKNVRSELVKIIDSFPKEKRSEVLFDQWNLYQILLHIAAWDRCIADNIKALKVGIEPQFYGKVNDFNTKNVEERKEWSWEKAYKEFIISGEELINEYISLQEELWEKKIWSTKKSTPLSLLKIVTKHYKEEHLPEIREKCKFI